MPTMYDLMISSACLCRDDAFRCLQRVAEMRREMPTNTGSRAVLLSRARFLLKCAGQRDRTARAYGLRLV